MIKHSSPQTTWVYFSVWLHITVPSLSEARAGSQGRLAAGTEAQAGEECCSLAHTPQLLQTVLRVSQGWHDPVSWLLLHQSKKMHHYPAYYKFGGVIFLSEVPSSQNSSSWQIDIKSQQNYPVTLPLTNSCEKQLPKIIVLRCIIIKWMFLNFLFM